MKYFFFFCVFLTSAIWSIADEAPVQPVPGGCVKPIKNNDIQLQSEIINLYLEQDKYRVEVVYHFKNFGKAQKITMGFPNQTSTIYTKTIENFSAYEGIKKIGVYKKFEATEVTSNDTMWTPRKFYECSDLFFKEQETKTIKNTYTQEYGTNYDNSYRLLEYILTTGSLWKNHIESIKINVFIENISENELITRHASFEENEKITYPSISLQPEGFKKNELGFSTELTNIEPDFDIKISFPPKLINTIEASSSLENNTKRYGPKNAIDNNTLTAWVEGAKDAGINEYLIIDITPYFAGGKIEGCYLIDKIGIINGYIKSDETFKNNNRVKKLKIRTRFYMESNDTNNEDIFEFNLKDQQEIQYLYFDKPLRTSVIKFEILDVFNGEKYDDTCISEILIYPSDQ